MRMQTMTAVFGVTAILLGCASTPSINHVQTMQEAAKTNEDWESGIYNKRNGENVMVEVISLRAKLSEAEKRASDADRRADSYRRDLEQIQYENQLLRIRGNIKSEKEIIEVKSFDMQNNPTYERKKVIETTDVLPARNPASTPY